MKKENGSIHAGHRSRLRERFFKGGLDVFAPHEVIEMLLFYAIPKKDVNGLAHELIDRFGSIDAVLRASDEELMSIKGVGPYVCKVLHTIEKVSSYYEKERFRSGTHLRNIADAINQARNLLLEKDEYRMTVLFETVDGKIVTSRNFRWDERNEKCAYKVVSIAMETNAYRVTVLLKSGSGVFPPGEMKEINDMLTALYNAEVFTADCVVFAQGHVYSMRKENMLRMEESFWTGTIRDDGDWLEPLYDLRQENGWYRLEDLKNPSDELDLSEWMQE